MNRSEFKEHKATVRDFMQKQYTDDRLVQLLDHARSGKLIFLSCCCFIGIVNADHELKGQWVDITEPEPIEHYLTARYSIPGAAVAEGAYYKLSLCDVKRRRVIIPMVLAEFRRRSRLQISQSKETVNEFATQSR